MISTKPCPKCKKQMILVATDTQATIKLPPSYLRLWWCGCGYTERARQDEAGVAFDAGRRAQWMNENAREAS